MTLLFDSFWRALVGCLRPRVILLSLAPLLLVTLLSLGLTHFYWDSALTWVGAALEASTLLGTMAGWMQTLGLGSFKPYLAALILIFAATPVLVLLSLLLVALLMTPAVTVLVAGYRFPLLERKNGGSALASLSWSLLSTLLALVALVVSMPLWLIPPLILVLPPLIWGWLTYRVMAFDALSLHASSEERAEIFRRHGLTMLGIGVFCGYLGAAPGVIFASGVLFAAAFVVLLPVGIWLYTLVFALSSLWFTHYCLAALQALRAERAVRTERRSSGPVASPVSDVPLKAIQTHPLPYESNSNPPPAQ